MKKTFKILRLQTYESDTTTVVKVVLGPANKLLMNGNIGAPNVEGVGKAVLKGNDESDKKCAYKIAKSKAIRNALKNMKAFYVSVFEASTDIARFTKDIVADIDVDVAFSTAMIISEANGTNVKEN